MDTSGTWFTWKGPYIPSTSSPGGSISAGRQTGRQFWRNCPEPPPRSNLEDSLWKSSLHTEIVHICSCLLMWVCCADPPSIHVTSLRISKAFLTSLMGNNSVPCSEWMLPKPSVDVGNRTSGHEKKNYISPSNHRKHSRALFCVFSILPSAQARHWTEDTAIARLALLSIFVEGEWTRLNRRPLKPTVLEWFLWK